jgi:hypothetical protein
VRSSTPSDKVISVLKWGSRALLRRYCIHARGLVAWLFDSKKRLVVQWERGGTTANMMEVILSVFGSYAPLNSSGV